MTEPLAVYDVREDGWYNLPDPDRDRLADWVRGQGLDPNVIYRLETHLLDCPFARVYAYEIDADGRKRVTEDRTDVVRLPPRDVPVSSLPPVAPWKGGDAP